MQVAADNGNQHFKILEQIATNVANVNTTGYKAKRFELYLRPDGVLEGDIRTDTANGNVMITKRAMDVAIKTDGYIPVTQPDGTTAYTRDGSFTRNQDGYLSTFRGDLVGPGIQLPANYETLQITQDGTVQTRPKEGAPWEVHGKIPLVTFPNPEGLKTVGGNKLLPTETSGLPAKFDGGTFVQGSLERANVNPFNQIDSILRLNAGLISNFRIIKFSDDIFRQAVNLRQ
jgi:flagellar basal-body rod protein FlgG